MKALTAKNKSRIYQGKSAPLAACLYIGLVLCCVVFADLFPLPFSAGQLDLAHRYLPPFQWQTYSAQQPFHWFGTDHLGRDVLANMVYGCRTAFILSIPPMAIATTVGLLLGGIAGYYGNRTIKVSMVALLLMLITVTMAYYYGFYIRQTLTANAYEKNNTWFWGINWLLFSGILSIGIILSRWLNKRISIAEVNMPVDQIILKCIELLSSIPRIIFILCLTAYARPSLLSLILITGFTYWTEPARLIRAELLQIKALNYIESARAMGLADFYILIRHALPNALSSIIVAATFGIAGLVSLESTLSFLNIGMPADIASWGKMVASVRNNLSAWWLVLFPGIALCCTVLSVQAISNWLIDKLNPKSR